MSPHFTVYLPKLRISFLFIVYMFANRALLTAMTDSGNVGSCRHVWPQGALFTSLTVLRKIHNSNGFGSWPDLRYSEIYCLASFCFFLCIYVPSVYLRILEQFWTLRNQNRVTREDYGVWNWSGLYLVEQAPPHHFKFQPTLTRTTFCDFSWFKFSCRQSTTVWKYWVESSRNKHNSMF